MRVELVHSRHAASFEVSIPSVHRHGERWIGLVNHGNDEIGYGGDGFRAHVEVRTIGEIQHCVTSLAHGLGRA
jgi:hypothetical protein